MKYRNLEIFNRFIKPVSRWVSYNLKTTVKMPKDPKHAKEMKKQRIKNKSSHNDKLCVPSVFYLNVLSNGRRGSPGVLYVFSGNNRYLFNCGEGTQRLAHEHKFKLAKLENIFFTYKNWSNIGGLPGLTLTVQDIGIPELILHGPPEIEEIYRMTKGFLVTKDIDIKSYNEEIFSDNAMKVKAVKLYSTKSFKLPEKEAYVDEDSNDEDEFKNSSDSSKLSDFMPKLKRMKTDKYEKDFAMIYICKLHPKPGQLNLEKCVEAGVPPGPLLGILKKGEDVHLPDGSIVHSKDVTEPEEIGATFIVMECPTEEFLAHLNSCTDWSPYQLMNGSIEENFPSVIVHFTPPNVIKNKIYQDWMNKFSPSTHHMILNESNISPNSLAVHRIQYQLNHLQNKIFPLLNSPFEAEVSNILKKFHLRPRHGLEESEIGKVKPEDFIKEINTESYKKEVDDFNKQLLKVNHDASIDLVYPKVTFFGTGSSIPSKVRNTSGILVELSEEKSIMFDIGEGIFGQILNYYGEDKIDSILRKIGCVFISHLHADHHLGFIQFLKERVRAFQENNLPYIKLQLIAPGSIMKWFRAYHNEFEPICELFNIISNQNMIYNDKTLPEDLYQNLILELELKELLSIPVKHCWQAFGITITHKNGWKIVYSGDTMPCQNLVDAGMNCDLLIHEATMEDDLEQDAAYKAHSTTSQAISIGKSMQARFTVLTHFSQRYAKVPLLDESFASEKVGIAFDNMTVSPCDLPMLPYLQPALKEMFSEHFMEMENKKLKRQLRRERENEQTKN